MTYFLKFWDPLHISGTVKARNFKFGTQIGQWGPNEKKCKITSKGVVMGSDDLLFEFWDPSIYRERLKLETSNLPCRLATRVLSKKNAKLGQKGS